MSKLVIPCMHDVQISTYALLNSLYLPWLAGLFWVVPCQLNEHFAIAPSVCLV